MQEVHLRGGVVKRYKVVQGAVNGSSSQSEGERTEAEEKEVARPCHSEDGNSRECRADERYAIRSPRMDEAVAPETGEDCAARRYQRHKAAE